MAIQVVQVAPEVPEVPDENEMLYQAWKKEPTPELENRLYRKLHDYAQAIVRGKFRIPDRDLISDIVTKAFLHEEEFQGAAKFTTWFHKLASNACRDYLRRQRRRREIQISDVESLPQPEPEIYDLAIHKNLAALLQEVSEDDRKLIAYVAHGLRYREIGRLLGTSEPYIRLRWHRLRQELKKSYQKLEQKEPHDA